MWKVLMLLHEDMGLDCTPTDVKTFFQNPHPIPTTLGIDGVIVTFEGGL